MFRSKDILYMDVYNKDSKKIGTIDDILLNFNEREVIGFKISSMSILQKITMVFVKDILSFTDYMIINKCSKVKKYGLSNIKGMEAIDTKGKILGVLDDIIFDKNNFQLKGIVISSGVIDNYVKGKQIYSTKKIIIGEKTIFIINDNSNVILKNIPKKISLDVVKYERKK